MRIYVHKELFNPQAFACCFDVYPNEQSHRIHTCHLVHVLYLVCIIVFFIAKSFHLEVMDANMWEL